MKSLENVHCLLPSNLRTSFKWLIEEVEEGLFSFETEAEIFFFFLWATPTAYGSSQARSRIGAADASLHRRHSQAGSKPRL